MLRMGMGSAWPHTLFVVGEVPPASWPDAVRSDVGNPMTSVTSSE